MCEFLSGYFLIHKDKPAELRCRPFVLSHSEQIEMDGNGTFDRNTLQTRICPWEIVPPTDENLDILNVSNWSFKWDDEIPKNEDILIAEVRGYLRQLLADESLCPKSGGFIDGRFLILGPAEFILCDATFVMNAGCATIQNANHATIQNANHATISNAGYATIQNANCATIQNANRATIHYAGSATIHNAGFATIHNANSTTIHNADFATIRNANSATIQNANNATIINRQNAKIS